MLWMHKGKGLKHHRLPHTCCSVFHFPRTSSCFGAEDPYMSPTCLKGKQFSSSQVIFQSFIWNLNLLDCIHTLLHLWKSCRYFKHSPHKGGKRLQNPACVNGLTNMVILGWCMRHLSSEQISMAVIEKKPRNFFDLTDSYQSGSIELQNTDVLTSAFCLCQNYSQSEGTQEKVLSCFYHRVFLYKQREEGSPLPSHPTQQEHGVFALHEIPFYSFFTPDRQWRDSWGTSCAIIRSLCLLFTFSAPFHSSAACPCPTESKQKDLTISVQTVFGLILKCDPHFGEYIQNPSSVSLLCCQWHPQRGFCKALLNWFHTIVLQFL